MSPAKKKQPVLPKLQMVPLERLVFYDGNPRIEGSDQVERLKESLAGFGFVEPVIAFEDPELKDGKLLVIVGHQRLKAARERKEKAVPTIVYPFDDKRHAVAYNITSNRTAELSTWDFPKLKDNIEYLDVGPELNLELTGFRTEEIEGLMTFVKPDFQKTKEELDQVAVAFIARHGDKGMLRVLFFRFEDEQQFDAMRRLFTLKGGRECDAARLWDIAKEHVDEGQDEDEA